MDPASEEANIDSHVFLYQVGVLHIESHCNWYFYFPFLSKVSKFWGAHTMPTQCLTSFFPIIGTSLIMFNTSIESK